MIVCFVDIGGTVDLCLFLCLFSFGHCVVTLVDCIKTLPDIAFYHLCLPWQTNAESVVVFEYMNGTGAICSTNSVKTKHNNKKETTFHQAQQERQLL